MRLFVGIPLAPAVEHELAAVVARLSSKSDGLRWMPPESWHITLQFLGNTGDVEFECVKARLNEVRAAPVSIQMEGLGFFDRASVFFAGVTASEELVTLAHRVIAATGQCGFVAETRPFHPHITLARAKGQGRGKPLQALAARMQRQPDFSRFVARKFLLYESHTEREGARYDVRARYRLGAAHGT